MSDQPIFLMTDQQKAQAFLDEYKTLRDKYGFDFISQIGLVKINANTNTNTNTSEPPLDPVADKKVDKKPTDGNKK